MKKISCEMCGSNDLIKQNGVFVCQSCGAKYSVEEAKKMMIESPADVSENPAKIDNKAANYTKSGDAAKKKKILSIVLTAAVIVAAISIIATKVIIPSIKYNAAVELMESGEYEEAITAFEALDGYKDSTKQIAACEAAITDNKYNAAIALMDGGKYEEAIAAFEALDGYEDSADKIQECNYGIAVKLIESGNIIEAYDSLIALGNYKDSTEKAENILNLYRVEKLKTAKVGDYVYFGSYEQDNNKSNGAEDIEWLVLDKQDNKILVISKYGLDAKPYNKEHVDVTWEKCTLRSWLNDDFYNTAFSAEEQKQIQSTVVSADKNPKYSTNPGNDTTDKVFLLNITEANTYFSSGSARQCAPTDYAIAQGAYINSDYKVDGKAACWWWLRSPGNYQFSAAVVTYDGAVYCYGRYVDSVSDCVRPALWINLEA